MKRLGGTIREGQDNINGRYVTTDILQRNDVLGGRRHDFLNGEIKVVIAEEPVVPKPVQVFPRRPVEAQKHIPGRRVFAVPVVHECVQRRFEQVRGKLR